MHMCRNVEGCESAMSGNYEQLCRKLAESPHQSEVRELPPSVLATLGPNANRPASEVEFDVQGLIRGILRRRRWIYVSTSLMIAAAALVCLAMSPRYRAESTVEILRRNAAGLSLPKDASGSETPDDVNMAVSIQTKMAVLQSETLAWQVLQELNLVTSAQGTRNANGDAAPDESAALVLKRFKSHLKVDSVSGTRLIRVSYVDRDPKLAARIVNQVISDFVNYSFQVRYNATNKATTWLGGQLEDLKKHVEQSEQRAAELQMQSGIFGQDETHNIVISRLEQLNDQVTAAEADLILKQGLYNLCREGDAEAVAEMLGKSASSSNENANSAVVVHSLREQEARLSAEYADASSKYGAAYPRLVQISERLDSVRESISAELSKAQNRAKREYELAAAREAAAKKSFAEQKALAADMNSRAIEFRIARHEADSSRELYDSLLKKLKEAGVLAGLHSSDVQVVDIATVPVFPYRPNFPIYLLLGALAGFSLGLVAVVVADALDHTVRDVSQIEFSTRVPIMGVVPNSQLEHRQNPARLFANRKQQSHERLLAGLRDPAVAEAFRTVRTSLLLSVPEDYLVPHSRVFMITSPMENEGKSFACLNLAAAFACSGSKVLLVDADLRRGTLSRVLSQHNVKGLSDLLTDDESRAGTQEAYRTIESLPGVTLIPAGPCPQGAAELLGSSKMGALVAVWRSQFEYVVLDTSPVLPVTDPVVLSTHTDAVVVVIRFATSTLDSLSRTIALLKRVNARRLCLLVNAMDVRNSAPYGYYYAKREASFAEGQLLVPPSSPSR